MKKITLLGLILIAGYVNAQTPVVPPYSNDFNNAANFTGTWSYENPAGQGEWTYSADFFGIGGTGSVVFLPDDNVPSNCWLFSNPFTLTAGINYALDFKYINLSSGYNSNLKVSLGTQNNSTSMTTQIVNIGTYDLHQSNLDLCALSHNGFSVPTTGTYYIGFNDAGSFAPDMNGGQSIDDFSLTIETSVEAKSKANIKIYPNPITELVTILLPDINNPKVSLIDITGRVIFEETANCSNYSFNATNLPNGIYFVKIIVGNNVIYTEKIGKY